MKIKSIDNTRLRNNEHFQFHTELKDLITGIGTEKLKIGDLFEVYLPVYAREDEAFKKIVKNATTEEIEIADHKRDHIFSGLVATNKAHLNHFDAEVSAAARRLKVVFNTYGNLAGKPINEETSAIYNLLQELTGASVSDVQKVGLSGWVAQLEVDNNALEALVKMRNDENTAKTQLKVKETRADVDKAYTQIVERVNALIIVEGEAEYAGFVNKLNGYIDKYNQIVAQRIGRYAKGKEQIENK